MKQSKQTKGNNNTLYDIESHMRRKKTIKINTYTFMLCNNNLNKWITSQNDNKTITI